MTTSPAAKTFAWLVLGGLFIAEVAALVALFVWGWSTGGWLLAVAVTVAAVLAWGLFASPQARFPHPTAGLLVKVAVFAGAVVGLWASGHPGWAVGLLGFVVLVHAAARLPVVRAVDPRGI